MIVTFCLAAWHCFEANVV